MKMKNRILRFVLFLPLMTTSLSAQVLLYQDPDAPIEERVEDALSRMTLEEKVALCHAQSKFSSAGVPRLGIPEVWMSDGPHGVRHEFEWDSWNYAGWTNDSITAFPALTALAATWNSDMAALYGKAIGEEARYRKKDVLLGPGVNIYRTPLNGRNFEYMGEDPYLAGTLVVPYIKELQKNGVAACVKHFALNNQERWRGTIDVEVSDRALYEIYLPAFKKAVVEGGAWSIMGAYNKYRGEHCCHNARLLNDILRGEWGFDGCVITDWGGTHDTKEAAFNGLDIEMGSYTNGLSSDNSLGYNCYYLADPYLAMLKKGELPMSTVDAKARNVLRMIFRTSLNHYKPYGSLCTTEHYEVAKVIGDESIVLLKNNGILPLEAGKYERILVVGDNATRRLTDGGGSSELKPKDLISPLDALRALYGDKVDYAQGYICGYPFFGHEEVIPQHVMDSLRAEAVEKARRADVIIYVGGLNKNAFQDCESTDRRSYHLPFAQDELIEALLAVNPNLVMANISGNAYAMPWLKKVPAVLHISYLGTMGGASIADVISGKVNPSGKLPYSFPVKLTDCSAHAFDVSAYPGVDVDGVDGQSLTDYQRTVGVNPKQEYKEDILVGYRWHDTKKIPALFGFGHGLSYTSFKYGKSSLSAKEMSEEGFVKLTVPVTNTGTLVGKEVVQVYIGDPVCSVLRPLKELKHFAKVEINPGETVSVEFTITADDLKFFDEVGHRWVAEPGVFNVYVGASSTDIRGTHSFKYIENKK